MVNKDEYIMKVRNRLTSQLSKSDEIKTIINSLRTMFSLSKFCWVLRWLQCYRYRGFISDVLRCQWSWRLRTTDMHSDTRHTSLTVTSGRSSCQIVVGSFRSTLAVLARFA